MHDNEKYLVIYHSTKKIECITILWWVLVIISAHLTSRLTSNFSCTLYHAFTPCLIKFIPSLTLKFNLYIQLKFNLGLA